MSRSSYITVVVLMLAALFAAGWERVPDGETAVVRVARGGAAAPRILAPGLHFTPPLLFRLHRYDRSPVTRRFTLGGPDDPPPHPVSREGALLRVEGEAVLRMMPGGVERFHRHDGTGLLGRRFRSLVGNFLVERLRSESIDSSAGGLQRLGLELAADLRGPLADAGIEPMEVRITAVAPLPGTRMAVPGWERAPGRSGARVVWIGWDGADWDIIDRLVQAGRMPHLAGLIETGTRARLRTVEPILSPVIWTSIATGTSPQRHGIIDFVATDRNSGERVPVTSNLRRTRAIWDLATEAGLRVGVTGWLATWPAEPVRGYLVSERIVPVFPGFAASSMQNHEGKVYPESDWDSVRAAMVPADAIGAGEMAAFLPIERIGELPVPARSAEMVEGLRGVIAATRSIQAVARRLRNPEPPDLEVVYFLGIDRVSHLFMPYRPPRMKGIETIETELLGGVVDRFYQYQDRLLGEWVATVAPGTTIILCSDHGFRSGTSRPRTDPRIGHGRAADWHRPYGILVLNGPPVRRGKVLERASVLDLAPTVLAILGLPVPADLEGRVLVEGLSESFLASTPVRYRAPVNLDAGGLPPDPVVSAEDEAIRRQLLSLGYLSQDSFSAHNNLGILALGRGDPDAAITEFEIALAANPAFGAIRINLARALIARGDTGRARSELRRVVVNDPGAREAWLLLAGLARAAGPEVAARYFRRAIALDPNDPVGHLGLGSLYESEQKWEEAEEEYRKVLEIDPDHSGACNSLGSLYLRTGHPNQARNLFAHAVAINPDHPAAYNNLAVAWQEMGEQDRAEAIFRQGLKRFPARMDLQAGLGGLLLQAGRLKEAQQVLETALRIDPDHPVANNNLGGVYALAGDLEAARRHYRRALTRQPGYSDARYNLALALRGAGENGEVVRELQAVLEQQSDHLPSLLLLARVLAEQGSAAAAVTLLESGLARHPDRQEVRQELQNMRTRAAAEAGS